MQASVHTEVVSFVIRNDDGVLPHADVAEEETFCQRQHPIGSRENQGAGASLSAVT